MFIYSFILFILRIPLILLFYSHFNNNLYIMFIHARLFSTRFLVVESFFVDRFQGFIFSYLFVFLFHPAP